MSQPIVTRKESCKAEDCTFSPDNRAGKVVRYAFALGALGGVLQFLPTVGWIASALTILTVGFLVHSHWIWMAGLLVAWRLVLLSDDASAGADAAGDLPAFPQAIDRYAKTSGADHRGWGL